MLCPLCRRLCNTTIRVSTGDLQRHPVPPSPAWHPCCYATLAHALSRQSAPWGSDGCDGVCRTLRTPTTSRLARADEAGMWTSTVDAATLFVALPYARTEKRGVTGLGVAGVVRYCRRLSYTKIL